MSERVLGIARLGSIREISIYAGVAESTVNRALKGHPSVSDQTRARVISAVWEINIAKIRQINGARRRAPSDGISTWDNQSMTITITTAPCCWGVDDVKNPHLPHWEKVLDEAAEAGFGGLELGPYGYLPLDRALVSDALDKRGLKIVAGTIFDDLVDPANLDDLLRQTDEICSLITRLPAVERYEGQRYRAPYLTVMDWGHDERDYAAGHSDLAPRLDPRAWAGMIGNIRAIALRARDQYGIRATIHPHAGGYIELADELEQLVNDIPDDIAGLCLDTGHLAYAGMDPVATLRRYWERTDYIHFKDIDPNVFDEVMQERIRFFDACAKGVMCPIGRGSIDYPAIRRLLSELGYAGYITIEQERDPRNAGSILADLAASRDFLRRTGF